MKTDKFLAVLLTAIITLTSFFTRGQNLLSQPGYYNLPIGEFEVIALIDGTVPVDANKLLKAPKPGQVNQFLKEAYLTDPIETSINTYLIKAGDKLILVDTGAGELFGPETGGKLITSLKSVSFTPGQITDVLLTHIHIDHSGGLTTKGNMAFPNATIHVNKKEIDFWLNHEQPSPADTRGITANRPAFTALKPYLTAGKVKTFIGSTELFPGLSTLEYSGHTPGHSLYILESNKDKLIFWGDLIHVAAVQLHGPEIPNEYDFDKSKAALQRRKAYHEAAQQGYLIAADHISFPGIGRIKATTKGFDWVPVPYSLLGRH